MNVREARFIGVFAGLISGITSFEYNSLISLSIGSIGVLSFFMGKKVVKGTRGGLLEGVGIGLFMVSALQSINLIFGTA